jgi:D-alanyl-D-alanine carboxypeptidase/D-alanyl-D-alanine-endopeptidase (penicillin-binding protein 4)
MISCFKKPAPLLVVIVCSILASCSVNRQVAKQAKLLLADSAISTGHMGISIYEPATGKYWYSHNATQYFIPASNTKLFSLYVGMKYLGDSLVGMRYKQSNDTIVFKPAADPTFLHSDYLYQPVFNFLSKNKIIVLDRSILDWSTKPLGFGWAWDDFNEDYMIERSEFPIYNNLLTIKPNKQISIYPEEFNVSNYVKISPRYFQKNEFFLPPEIADFSYSESKYFKINRKLGNNIFNFVPAKQNFLNQTIPFSTVDSDLQYRLLEDTLGKHLYNGWFEIYKSVHYKVQGDFNNLEYKIIHSQPSDSLFKPMMHNSDNFFAEQTVLMASNEYLGYMSDEKIIDTILKTTLKDVPQKPKWVDGSGLSRYNLFTPNSFVYILNKMKNEFGLERMKVILATGGEGTLSSYYKNIAGNIYAKTGTLSNNCALSGYLITAKGKLLIFSVLNNNYITGATPVRRSVERFLQHIQKKY